MKILNKIAVSLIKFYQKYISILFPPSCRFYPSCSEYAKLAFLKYNFFKALGLTIYRILRCNPFNKGGYDPLK
ncbi:MAG TPA: membrane protein insertion efficiency factor YidD [Spirochaetota bacterium]|nr:membrane protein insertion efficiency factor YidD [Spirochaetota bacterium]HOL56007.1 membrane protein insertion efficiency factor YidD [Spirochaetota bacterium]HPP03449.1 membrane protein insertion efficiency factor YidD [Spirochaetota bacterium]